MKLPALILLTIFGYVPGDPILDFETEVAPSSTCEVKTTGERSHSLSYSQEENNSGSSCSVKPACDFQASFNNNKMKAGTTISLVDIIEFKYLNCSASSAIALKGPIAL